MKRGLRQLRLALVAMVVLCSLGVWKILDKQRNAYFDTLVAKTTEFSTELIARDLRNRHLSVWHLDRPWREGDGYVRPEEFFPEAERFLEEHTGLRAVAVFTPEKELIFRAPKASKEVLTKLQYSARQRHEMFQLAENTRQTIVSHPFDLVDGGGRGFLLFVPVFGEEDRFRGVVSLVFSTDEWLNHLFANPASGALIPTLSVELLFGDEILYSSPDFQSNPFAVHAYSAVPVLNTQLSIRAKTRREFFELYWFWMPEGIAVMVLMLFSLTAVLTFALRRARHAEGRSETVAVALRRLNKRLRGEVEERRSAERDAKKAREATARFLATMSHEIRTPLNAIMGMFQLIETNDNVPNRQRRQAKAGIEASRRLHLELTKVLDISRLDAGALAVNLQPSDIHRLAREWAESMEAFVARSGKPIKAEFILHDSLPETAMIDASALTQVVHNLIDNAVKFTQTGEISLVVRPDGCDLIIEVIDSGIGIPHERLEHVFDRFFQVENGIGRNFSGTGLGLAISRDLVRLMNGHIKVTNRVRPDVTAIDTNATGAVFCTRLREALDITSTKSIASKEGETV